MCNNTSMSKNKSDRSESGTDKTEKALINFENTPIRRIWDAENQKWLFAIVDVIQILTDSSIPKRYWSDLKRSSKLRVFRCTIES